MRVPKLVMLHVGFFGLAGAISASCFTVDYPVTAFRCNPSQTDACPDGYICCSDDPSAMKGTDVIGILPEFQNRPVGSDGGVPIFAGNNNALSTKGMCVEDGALPPGAGLIEPPALGCPVPCNPRWGDEDTAKVCGPNSICCQTVEITAQDCVFDGCWRPADGSDVNDPGVQGLNFPPGTGDPWNATTHDTHQDPGGGQCTAFSLGDPDAKNACFSALTVADQRGFCLSVMPPNVLQCPLDVAGYIDACEQLNIQDGLCGSCSCG